MFYTEEELKANHKMSFWFGFSVGASVGAVGMFVLMAIIGLNLQ